MSELEKEDERLRRIYSQHTGVHNHMDTESSEHSILQPAYKCSCYTDCYLIAGTGCSSILYSHSDPGPVLSERVYFGPAGKLGGVASQGMRKKGMVKS